MLQILEIQKRDQLLIVAPHPDDECIGAGGILACCPDICQVIVLTDGRQGQGNADPQVIKKTREDEFAEEMKAAGIENYRMLGYEDGTLMQHTDCLENQDLSLYTKIFVTGIHDGHPDHTAACVSVFQALHKQEVRDVEIFLYEVHSPLHTVTHMLDITDVIDKKLQLIRFHRSQLITLPYDKLAETMAAYRALQNRLVGCYVEVYTYMNPGDSLEDSTIGLEHQLQKSTLFYWVFTRWMELKIQGFGLARRLERGGYCRIAVYGYAEIGKLLCQELLGTSVHVEYVMDKKVSRTGQEGLPIYVPQKGLPQVDAVIVTAVYYFDEIKKELLEKGYKNIISFRMLLEKSDLLRKDEL